MIKEESDKEIYLKKKSSETNEKTNAHNKKNQCGRT